MKIKLKEQTFPKRRFFCEIWDNGRRIFKSTSDGGNYTTKQHMTDTVASLFPGVEVIDETEDGRKG